ncbi:MAG: hypothetical protein ACK5JH_12665 [Anaerocolumna sp.]
MKKKNLQKICVRVLMLTLLVGIVPTNPYAKTSAPLLNAEKNGTIDLASMIHNAMNEHTETIANSTFHHYVGSKSLKSGVGSAAFGSSVRLRQMVENDTAVTGKTYTFSGYVKTVGQKPIPFQHLYKV